ncbi:unannotated protein [freshwater metagenome]|uniref:Unannotated protein n=1 Tax=freshwater metagenome TaxID=449393 RepID=A0A6J6JQP1_9ZZZZ
MTQSAIISRFVWLSVTIRYALWRRLTFSTLVSVVIVPPIERMACCRARVSVVKPPRGVSKIGVFRVGADFLRLRAVRRALLPTARSANCGTIAKLKF